MQAYNKTDQQLHWLCQTIAKANRTFVPAKPDDSHTNLYFDALGNRIVGHWIESGNEKIMLTLNLESLNFEWLNSAKKVLQSVTTLGKRASTYESELEQQLPALKLKPQGFIDALHFQIPEYSFAKEAIERIDVTNLNEWKSYRKLANNLSATVLGYLQIEGDIRIWPHHFDTGIYVEVDKKIGLGFGLAMQDEMAGAPYFYLSGYALQGSVEYQKLPKFEKGRWEIGKHWQGAILPLIELSSVHEENQFATDDFLLKSTNWFLSQ